MQLSPHTVSHMWKQQLRQIDQLSPSQNQNRQTQSKLLKQVRDLTHTHTQKHTIFMAHMLLNLKLFQLKHLHYQHTVSMTVKELPL